MSEIKEIVMRIDDYELIEQYLDGVLDKNTAKAFEQRLQQEPDLAEEYTLRMDMEAYLRNTKKREAFKAEIEKLGEKYFEKKIPDTSSASEASVTEVPKPIADTPSKPNRIRRLWPILLAAAAITLFIFLLFPGAEADLYQKHARHYPLALTEMSATVNTSDIDKAFNAQEYEKAKTLLDVYVADHPDDIEAKLYRGICLLELGDLKEAVSVFSAILGSYPAYKNEAAYYLALVAVKSKDWQMAEKYLQEISASSDRGKDARRLLQAIARVEK